MQARRPRQVGSLKAFARAVVEQDRVANRIPDSGEPHATRSIHREVQAAWLPAPFENLFVELEGSRQELASITNDLLNALPEFFETRWFQSATPP